MLKKVSYYFYFPPKIIFLNNLYNKEITCSFSKKKQQYTPIINRINDCNKITFEQHVAPIN